MTTATASRRRGRGRELRLAEHLERTEGGLARRFESGCFDIVFLRPYARPVLFQVKSTLAPYSHFGPQARDAAREQAEQAGAEAWLIWWPKGKGLSEAEWIPSNEWP